MKATGKVLTIIILATILATTLYFTATNVLAVSKNKPEATSSQLKVYTYRLESFEAMGVPDDPSWGTATVTGPEFDLTPLNSNSAVVGASIRLEVENTHYFKVYLDTPADASNAIFFLNNYNRHPFWLTPLMNDTPGRTFVVGSPCCDPPITQWNAQWEDRGRLPVAGLENYHFRIMAEVESVGAPFRLRNLELNIYYLDGASGQ
jgi:hypothetical protein